MINVFKAMKIYWFSVALSVCHEKRIKKFDILQPQQQFEHLKIFVISWYIKMWINIDLLIFLRTLKMSLLH